MTEKTYNGWTNYETWNVALWIDNEQNSHSRRRILSQAAWNAAETKPHFTREEDAVRILEDDLKEWITDEVPDLGACLHADLLGAALSEVNWREIAENFLEDVDKEEEAEEEAETAPE